MFYIDENEKFTIWKVQATKASIILLSHTTEINCIQNHSYRQIILQQIQMFKLLLYEIYSENEACNSNNTFKLKMCNRDYSYEQHQYDFWEK
jgi:hypothetical protein